MENVVILLFPLDRKSSKVTNFAKGGTINTGSLCSTEKKILFELNMWC